jgi:hypothetical protein
MLTPTIFGLLLLYLTGCLLRKLIAERPDVCPRGASYDYRSVQFRESGGPTASQWY